MNENDPPACISSSTGLTKAHDDGMSFFSETRSIRKLPKRLAESLGHRRSSLTDTIEFIRKAKFQKKYKNIL